MTGTPAQIVTVNGKGYQWEPGRGLDQDAVLGLAGWVMKLATRYKRHGAARGLDMADLVQAGYLGALAACKTYDPSHGRRFASWAAWRIKDGIAAACKGPALCSLDAPGSGGLAIADTLADGADAGGDAQAAIDAAAALASAGARDRGLLRRLFGIGREQEALAGMARRLGVSRGRLAQRINRALAMIRRKHTNQRGIA